MNNKYDLVIAYRIYPGLTKPTPIFNNDKYQLSKLCIKSFSNSLKGIKAKIFILLDNCPDNYEQLFRDYLESHTLEIIRLNGEGNAATFLRQCDLLLNQTDSDIIYFAEDDYFYLESAFQEMIKLIKENDVHFITPYNHPDTYNHPLHSYKKEILKSKSMDWIRTMSTTMTFMTKKQYLKETYQIFKSYGKNNYDTSIWMAITKLNAYSIATFLKGIMNKQILKTYIKLYLFSFDKLLFSKKYNLYQPKESISTHMENDFLAPGINWDEKFKEYLNDN